MKKIIIFILVALGSVYDNIYAYDFSAVASSGQTLYYIITSSNTVELIAPGGVVYSSSNWAGYTSPTGSLVIPSSVSYLGHTYSVTSIAGGAFTGCEITSVTIPSSIKHIGSWAFSAPNLDTINFPQSAVLLDEWVFAGSGWENNQPDGLVYLENVLYRYKGTMPANYTLTLPSNVNSIAGRAFSLAVEQAYTNLQSITFPSSLVYIGSHAFYKCHLTNISFPSGLKAIGDYAFWGNYFSSITIPNSVEYIGMCSFGQCGSLTTVNYNAVNANATENTLASPFNNCSNFTTLHIGTSVQHIPAYLFSNCTNIQGSLSLPTSLLSIGSYAFQGCTGITGSLQIKNSVQTIGQMAFYGCTGITSLTIGSAVDSIASSAFSNMTGLSSVIFNATNCSYAQQVFYNSSFSTLLFGNNVTSIPDYLITNNQNITSVSFPNTLTRIGSMNFTMCGLSGMLILPANLSQIGYGAFNYCMGLTSIKCNAIIPPTIETQYGMANSFNNGNWNTPLLVPCSSISAYQSAIGWSNFTNISGIGGCNYTVSLFVNNSSMGSVSGGGTYTQGATATISATANSGYHFDHWSDGNTQNPRSITVTGNISLTAYFEANPITQYTITVNSNNTSMGSVSGGGTFNGGTTTTITATANNGYHFTHWQDGNTSNPRTITVTSNATYTAYFEANPPTQYTITVNSNNATMGSASGGGTFNGGTTIMITATANSGYHFTHWQDGNTSNPRTITVTSNATYTAYFEANPPTQYTITVNSNNATMGSASGGGTFNGGTTTTITATANNGYHFTQWQDGNTSNPRTITVTSNATYTAYFAPTRYTITVNSNNTAMGSVSGGGTFSGGSVTTITASANNGHHFAHWQDGNTSNPRTIMVTGDATYTAYFAPTQYTITVNSNNTAMGSVSGGGTFNEGTTTTISAIANNGYHFTQWQDGNTSNPRTITVTGSAAYTAYFEADLPAQYTIIVTSANTAMGTVSGGGTYYDGTTINISAIPNSGYRFVRWNDNNTDNPRTVTVTADMSFTAYFESDGTQGIDDVGVMGYRLCVVDGRIHVTSDGQPVDEFRVYDVVGREVYRANHASETPALPGGVYLVKVGTLPARKVVVIK